MKIFDFIQFYILYCIVLQIAIKIDINLLYIVYL